MSDAFITSPVLKSQQPSEIDRNVSLNLRQKINHILRSFTQRELLFQAVNNIGIPKNFINPAYIESRPDSQLNKLYNTICALKKQVLRIKRYSDIPKPNHMFALHSMKNVDDSSCNAQTKKSKSRQFFYLNKQISPEKRIKQAIIQELEYRQKLQTKQNKLENSQKIKTSLNQKRRQAAKLLNKRSTQVYERQKQIQEKWFDKIISSQPSYSRSVSPVSPNYKTASGTRRQQNYDLVIERLEQSKTQFEQHIVEQQIGRVMKQQSMKKFKHRRLNSLNDRMNAKRLKSHQIRQRKHIYSQEEQFAKIKKMVQKQIKIKETRQHKNTKDSRNSETQIQTSTMMSTINVFRNADLRSSNYEKDDEKQNQIFAKINQKNQARQKYINSQVEKIHQKHKIEDLRRQAFKKTQFKLLTESSNNQSYVYQKETGLAKRLIPNSESPSIDPLEKNIKKKHQNIINNGICDQTIIRLRKLPKSVLEKKLKDFKSKELREIFAQNIVKFLH